MFRTFKGPDRQRLDLERIFTPERRRRLLIAIALGFLAGAIIFLIRNQETNQESSLFRGDFPAFYGAGTILSRGEGANLYDLSLQSSVQQEVRPHQEGYLAYAYPPWFAIIFEPLSKLSFGWAKALWMLILFGVTSVAARLLVNRWDLESQLAVHLFPPLLHANISGQNTALALLLLIIIGSMNGVLAGLASALLCFKPHYGVVALLGKLLIEKKIKEKFIAAFLTGMSIEFLLSYLVCGRGWGLYYFEALKTFSVLDWEVNRFQMVSIASLFSEHRELISVAIIAVGLCLVRYFREWILILPTIIFGSPHTLYYDLGLLIPVGIKSRNIPVAWTTASFVTGALILLRTWLQIG